jgi:hypothetical protein
MGVPRSTYYDAPPVKADDAQIVATDCLPADHAPRARRSWPRIPEEGSVGHNLHHSQSPETFHPRKGRLAQSSAEPLCQGPGRYRVRTLSAAVHVFVLQTLISRSSSGARRARV